MLPFPQRTMKHLRFRRIELDKPRYKKISVPPKQEIKNVEHGAQLNRKTEIVLKSFNVESQQQPPEFNPAFIFKVKLSGSVSEEELRRSKLTILSEEPDGVVILFSEDQLGEFRNRIGEFSKELEEKQKNPHYAWIAQVNPEDMMLWNRESRIGKKLKNETLKSDNYYFLDVELWVYGEKDDNESRMGQLEAFLHNHQGKILDRYRGNDLYLARIKISGEALDHLLDVGIIRSIDFPPEPAFEIGEILSTPIDEFPNPVNGPEIDSPGICIIDSGVTTGHPFLSKAIGDAKAFPLEIGSELDQNGHGTLVAGISLYGNVQACIDKLDFSPQFFLFSARVTNDKNQFDDEKLIVTQMREAITYFNQTYGCRVFNISLADPNLIYDGGKPSQWACVLDTFARELDLVIVVSAGNLSINGLSNHEAEQIRKEYPIYLLEENARILEPATAANVITVGSIAHSDNSVHSVRFPTDIIQPIACPNLPSPFTRRGPGVNNSIKPDVVEYGGNSTWCGVRKTIFDHDSGVEIVSMNKDFIQRLFRTDCGTSFSAPKVSYLAGLILKNYPGISANLIRALIANSAEVPPLAKDYFLNDDDIRAVYGYGLPDPQKALFSTDNRVTLISEDEILQDTIHIYEIPIPDSLKNTSGNRRISVSLAYDPPVRNTRKDYIGINLSFKLIRGLSVDQVVKWYSEREKKDDPIPDRYICDMKPSPTRREGGSLQKAEMVIQRNTAFNSYDGDKFQLIVFSAKGWATPDVFPSQRYAVVITLEHLGIEINLYNDIQNRVAVEMKDRVRLRG